METVLTVSVNQVPRDDGDSDKAVTGSPLVDKDVHLLLYRLITRARGPAKAPAAFSAPPSVTRRRRARSASSSVDL